MRKQYSSLAIAGQLVLVLVLCGCSNSDPTNPGGGDQDGGGIPDGYVVYSRTDGFFGDGYFSVRKEGWDTYFADDVTSLHWYDPEMDVGLHLQLPFSPITGVPDLPITWPINRGGYVWDGNLNGVSIEEDTRSSPPGYDAFLGVSGSFTLIQFNAAERLFVGEFHIVIGAFYLDDGFEYGGDHYYDTVFSDGAFNYQFSTSALGDGTMFEDKGNVRLLH